MPYENNYFNIWCWCYVSRIKDKNSANNGVIYGTTISVVLFGLIAFNCSDYIKFMNLNKKRS